MIKLFELPDQYAQGPKRSTVGCAANYLLKREELHLANWYFVTFSIFAR